MNNSDITLYNILYSINDSIKYDNEIGISPSIKIILESINSINVSVITIDEYINNIDKETSITNDQIADKNELIGYKSELLKMKSQLVNEYKKLKSTLITTQNIKGLVEKSIQLNTGDIF